MEKAHQVCIEMLVQRNYEIIDDEEDKIVALKPDGNQMIVFLQTPTSLMLKIFKYIFL